MATICGAQHSYQVEAEGSLVWFSATRKETSDKDEAVRTAWNEGQMTYDATALLLIYVFLAIPAFLAAIGITQWIVEIFMFAKHLWRTR